MFGDMFVIPHESQEVGTGLGFVSSAHFSECDWAEECYNNSASEQRQEFLRTLVGYVRSKEFLYNKKMKAFSKSDVKANSWVEIASNLSTDGRCYSGDELCKLWNKLREKWGNEKKKEEISARSGAAAKSVIKSEWFLFPDLEFLSEHVQPRNTSSSSFKRISESESIPESSGSSPSLSPLTIQRGKSPSPAFPRANVRSRGRSPLMGRPGSGLRTYTKRSQSQGSSPQPVGMDGAGSSGPSSMSSLGECSSSSGYCNARREAASLVPKAITPMGDIVKRRKRKSETDGYSLESSLNNLNELSGSLNAVLAEKDQPVGQKLSLL